MKGCLKVRSRSPSPGQQDAQEQQQQQQPQCPYRKCVAFGAKVSEEVHIADEWDRTPTEPTRKLTYQDLLELKEIQRSLPHADQPGDPLTGKPAKHYLSGVPIGLLPLLPDSDDSSQDNSSSPSPVTSPRSSSPTFPAVSPWNMNFHRSCPAPVSPAGYRPPPHLAHLLPSRTVPGGLKKSGFAFLPLLDTPPSSGTNSPNISNAPSRTPSPLVYDHGHESHDRDSDLTSDTDQSLDPPTPSLTNASLDSSPYSRASSCSPEPPLLQLPPPNAKISPFHDGRLLSMNDSYFPPQDDIYTAFPSVPGHRLHNHAHHNHDHNYFGGPSLQATSSLQPVPSPTLIPPSPLTLELIAPKPRPAKKRNFIEVNGIEIELDDDDDDEEPVRPEAVTKIQTPNRTPVDVKVKAQASVPEHERPTTPTAIEDTALSEARAKTIKVNCSVVKLDISTIRESKNLKLQGKDTLLNPQPPPTRTPIPSSSPSTRSPTTKGPVSPPRTPVSPSKAFLHHRHTHQHHSHHQPFHHEPRLCRSSSASSSPPVPIPSSPPVGQTTLNESVNLHIPILFKRGMRTASVGGRGNWD